MTIRALASGGHNLSAKVTEFRQSDAVAADTVKVETNGEKRVIFYNSKNENYPSELTGFLAKYGEFVPDDVLTEALNKDFLHDIPPPPRPVVRNVALGFSAEIKPSIDRGLQSEYTASRATLSGFRTVSRTLTKEQAEFVHSLGGETIKGTVVERKSPTSIMIYNGSSGEVIEATDRTGTIDALGQIARNSQREGRQPFLLFRGGFTQEEADALTGAVELNAEVEGVFVEVNESNAREMSLLVKDNLLDLKGAIVKDAVEITDARTGARGVEVVAEIPTRSRVQSFLMKIRLWFRSGRGSFAAFRENAQAAVREILAGIFHTGEDWSAIRIAGEAQRQLRQRFGEDVNVLLPQIRDIAARRDSVNNEFAG